MAEINEQNYPRFKKAYLQADKEGKVSFIFDNQEVLVAYAKYCVEYFDNRRGG